MKWEIKNLGDLCDIARGGSPRPIQKYLTNEPDGINWIKIGDASASSKYIYKTKEKIKPEGIKNSRFVEPGDFLLSNSMSFGRPYIMKTSGCIHDGWLVLKDKSGLFNQDYLYYFLGSQAAYNQFDKLAAGSTVRNLNTTLVKKVLVPIASLEEQKRIVQILDESFERIAQAEANTRKNLTNARELFDSYLNQIFKNSKYKEQINLSELTTSITDGDHQPPPKSSEGIPFITISNIDKQHRNINFSDTFKVPVEYFEKLKEHRKPFKGDVLYTVTGSYGIPVLVNSESKFCFQRHIGLIRPNQETDSKFLYYLLLSPLVKNQADQCATGTAQKTVGLKSLREFTVPKLSHKEQKNIVEKLDIISAKSQKLEAIYQHKLEALGELKQSILQKAFTGQLT